MTDLSKIPVVILSGGRGIFIDDSGERKSKGEVQISGSALITHVISMYLKSGFRRFIISGGYHLDQQRKALCDFFHLKDLGNEKMMEGSFHGEKIHIQSVDTGYETSTGERLKKVQKYLEGDKDFALTYSDTLSKLNLQEVYLWHQKSQHMCTLVSVRLPTRFRILGVRSGESLVRGFADKAFMPTHLINGGFYFFSEKIWPSLSSLPSPLILEQHLLEFLAQKGELNSFPYSGAWQSLDSERDMAQLSHIVQSLQV